MKGGGGRGGTNGEGGRGGINGDGERAMKTRMEEE